MRFNEFSNVNEDVKLPTNYQVPPSMRTQSNTPLPQSWVTKPGLDSPEYTDEPAYKRAGKNEPITTPKPGTKPTVNLADPRQAAAYKAQLDLEKAGVPLNQPAKDPVGSARPGAPFKPNYSLANDPVGMMVPGEPKMGTSQPAVWKSNRNPNQPASTSPISAVKPTTTTAPSALSQVGNTLSNIRKGMGKGSEYTNVYAPTGPTDFMNKQYVKDLEKEFAKTKDPVIKAELDKMRAPGIVAAKGTGTSGGRTTDVNDPRLTANIQPGSSDIRGTGRGPGMKNDPRLDTTQSVTPAVKPSASTGTSAPAPSTTSNQTFSQAFAAARDAALQGGPKEFDYKGKKYSTALKGEDPALDAAIAKQSAPSSTNTTTNTQNDNSTETSKQAEKLKALAQEPISTPKVIPDETNENINSLNRIKSLAGLK